MKNGLLSLGLPVALLCVGIFAPAARAQSARDSVPVSLNMTNAPISTALRSLFQAAGIRNFIIETTAAGRVNVSLQDVPFNAALRQILASAATPLMVVVEDGVYHVRLRLPGDGDDSRQLRFYKIGLKHYDAVMIAHLATHRNGLIDVPPNYVVNLNSGSVGSVPVQSAPAKAASPEPALAVPVSDTVLPDGVKRIFALQSDNSLVIEATPKGLAELTDLQLASEGYDLVY